MVPVCKMLVLLALTLALKIVEHAHHVDGGAPRPNAHGVTEPFMVRNVDVLYAICNLHLSLSIGSLGVIWGNLAVANAGPVFFLATTTVICLGLAGAISRGVVAGSRPTETGWADWDWRFGVVLPNGFGLTAMAVSTAYHFWEVGR